MKTIFEIEAELLDLSLKAMLNPAETIQLGVLAGLEPMIHEIAKLWHAQEASNEMARAWQGAWADVDRSAIKKPPAYPCIPLLEPLDDFNIRRRREWKEPGYHAGETPTNGIACPVCAGPLHDSWPGMMLYSDPGQLHVGCVGCGFTGRRVA